MDHVDAKTLAAADRVLVGESKQGRIGRLLPFLGPAFIASIAYVDPGNFTTCIEGGQVRQHPDLGGGQQPDGDINPMPVCQSRNS